jgi:hypothetical protein
MFGRDPEKKAQKEAEKAEKRATDAAEYRAKWDQQEAERAEKRAKRAEKRTAAEARAAKMEAESDSRQWRRDRERTAKKRADLEALLVEGETIEAVYGDTILTSKRIIQGKSRSIPYRSITTVDSLMFNGLRISFGDGKEGLMDTGMTSRKPEFTFNYKEDRDAAKQIILKHMLDSE